MTNLRKFLKSFEETGLLFLMAVQQSLRFFTIKSEVAGFVVSILALLVTVFMGRLIVMQKKNQESLSVLNERLEQKVMERTVELDKSNQELKDALSQVKLLSGILPMCSSCKKIRNDEGNWDNIEHFVRSNSEAEFNHSICPACAKKLYPEYIISKNVDEAGPKKII